MFTFILVMLLSAVAAVYSLHRYEKRARVRERKIDIISSLWFALVVCSITILGGSIKDLLFKENKIDAPDYAIKVHEIIYKEFNK